MSVFKYHAFIYFMRPPPWYGTGITRNCDDLQRTTVLILVNSDSVNALKRICRVWNGAYALLCYNKSRTELHVHETIFQTWNSIQAYNNLHQSWTSYFYKVNSVNFIRWMGWNKYGKFAIEDQWRNKSLTFIRWWLSLGLSRVKIESYPLIILCGK